MANSPPPAPSDRSHLLLDFPLRLFTALRTIRLYPATNPQVLRSNEMVLQAFEALQQTGEEEVIVLAISDHKLLVCGEHLADKDQARPQIQGLVDLFSRSKMHSLSFSSGFTQEECVLLTQTLSSLLEKKDNSEPVAEMLDKAGILSVTADTKRYVAIHEGEQVVREELLGSGLNISDEELASFVLSGGGGAASGVSKELIEELISRLPAAESTAASPQNTEELTQSVIELLKGLKLSHNDSEPGDTGTGGVQAENLLDKLDPQLLAKLINNLPQTPDSDAALSGALDTLPPERLNALVAQLIAQQPATTKNLNANVEEAKAGSMPSALQRLIMMKPEQAPAINQALAQNVDPQNLLFKPETTLAELPQHLLERLREPQWSAPVLASAAGQFMAQEGTEGGKVDFSAFQNMLGQYEHLLDQDQQAQVARQAGAQIASMEGAALGNMLTQKFKGIFGEQLYEQVMSQVSDELLDETVDQLTPKQLNRMASILTSDIPLHISKEGDPDFEPASDAVLMRLANTKKGAQIKQAVAQNMDARALLVAPETTVAELPEHLLQRLMQPEWSAPVLASAAQQIMEGQEDSNHAVDFSAFNKMLAQYEQVLDSDQQAQVARQAGSQLASMEGAALGNMLTQKFKGIFGEQLYEQVMSQVSDELLDETVEQLTPKQLNRMAAILTSDIPLHIGKGEDPDFEPASDAVLMRLANTKKGAQIKQAVAQNMDARTLLVSADTTVAELPEHLRQRLMQPEWSAPVLVSAAQQVVDEQSEPEQPVNFAAFNKMLAQYEQVLDRDQQAAVARQAGGQLASMEGVALGNILTQKFKGLFGEQLFDQIMGQVSDELLDETVEQLTPKQINRMVATLTSEIPLHIGKEEEPGFQLASDSILMRLAQTKRGPEIKESLARSLEARELLVAPETTVAELPESLRQRLMEPEWSAPMLAQAAIQAATSQNHSPGQVDFSGFNRMLDQYEQVLDQQQQTQVIRQAGTQLASMEGAVLGNLLTQKFKGIFGEQLYQQVMDQVSDEMLDETVAQLTPKQLNRMVATLTSDIPLRVDTEANSGSGASENTILKRLTHTKKGKDIGDLAEYNIAAHHLLHAGPLATQLPEQLTSRLHQPEWSAPVLVSAARQLLDTRGEAPGAPMHLADFEQMLERYSSLLSQEEQLQVAARAGAELANLEDQELGLVLVKKYKNIFGEQLYQQVIAQLSPERIERLTSQFHELAEGHTIKPADLKASEVEEAYQGLMETVRSEKMRAIIELHQEQKKQKELELQETLNRSRENLLHGKFEELEQYSFAKSVPEEVRHLLLNGEDAIADNLMMQLAIGMQHQVPRVRENAFEALAATAENLTRIGQWERFAKLLPALKQGLEQDGVKGSCSEKAITAISGLAGHYLTQEDYVSAHETLHFLQQLSQARSPQVREQAKDAQKLLSTQEVLTQLLHHFFHSERQQQTVGKILVELGEESAKFQLKQLFESESRFERKRLLGLIKQNGNPAVTLLSQQLRNDAPWYVLRNVIRLLGEVGTEAHFARIHPFISHSDPRVQQEVVATASKLAGADLKDFLLEALQKVDDSLKIRVTNHIATVHDERFVRPLTDLLESTSPFQGKNKTDLQVSICKALGTIGSKRATGSLSRVAQSKNMLGLSGYVDEVRAAAERALQQIRRASHDQHEEHHSLNSTDAVQVTSEEIQAAEQAIFALAKQGKPAEARGQLLDLIGTVAHAGDLATAERLRKRIYELDEAPLADIICDETALEQKKQDGISAEDMEIWAELTDQLGTKEFQTIYQAFSERKLNPEETIVSQGDKNDNLFFINQGSVKVSHLVDDRELFITSLSRGQLAGENFFTPSLWTVTLTSLTPARVYLLPQSALTQWQEKFPGLRAKLHNYYRTYDNISGMLQKKGLNRRKDERFTLARKIQVQPISTQDAPIGRGFRSETADISVGGMAFLIRISRQENARLLLGRRMQVTLPVGGKTGHMTFKGLVIGVQPYRQLIGNFSVHFRFDTPIDHQELQSILG